MPAGRETASEGLPDVAAPQDADFHRRAKGRGLFPDLDLSDAHAAVRTPDDRSLRIYRAHEVDEVHGARPPGGPGSHAPQAGPPRRRRGAPGWRGPATGRPPR